MKRVPPLGLLLVSLLPVLVAGRPIYHCRTTGWDGIFCCFTIFDDEPSCCDACTDGGGRAGCGFGDRDDDCCEVMVLRVTATTSKSKLDLTAIGASVGAFVRPDTGIVRDGGRALGTVPTVPRAGPFDPPLFLLHSTFLL